MATLLPEGKQSFTDAAGKPLVGGKVYTYDAGTSSPRPTYQDAAGTVPNTNPVVLDARGEATIFWSGAYKVVLKDASDDTIWSVDEVFDEGSSLRSDLAETGAGKGAGMVVLSDGRTVQKFADDFVSVTGFGAVSGSPSTASVQSAINTGKRVYVPAGDFTVGTLTLVNNVQIFGEGRLVSDNTGPIFTGVGVSGFVLSCRLKGGNVAQHGVVLTNCTDFVIQDSEFDGFGSSGSFHGAILINGTSSNFRISGNVCKNGLGVTAADISIGGSANGGVITGNRCVSANSEGITVQVTAGNPARLTVSNNYCAGHARHGILGVYDNGKPMQAAYSANVCHDNGWSGIYLQGQTSGVGNDSGQVSCTGNICVANGGVDSAAIFNSGIYVAGDLGYSIVGNTVVNSGFNSAGVARTYAAEGIKCSNAENAVVSSNNIRNSSRYGIELTGTSINNVTITDNVVVDSGVHQISLSVNGAGVVCRNLVLKGNQLNAITTDPNGIVFGVSSTAEWRDFTVAANKITGRKLGTSKRGVWLYAATVALMRGDVFGNTVFNHDAGIYSNSSQAHLAYGGRNVRIKDNSLISCTEGINVPSGSAAWALIDYNVYSGNTTDVVGTWVRRGKVLPDGRVEMQDTAAPSFAAWGQGDRVWNTAPSAAGAPGWVCVTAGTPGTWKAMANLAS